MIEIPFEKVKIGEFGLISFKGEIEIDGDKKVVRVLGI